MRYLIERCSCVKTANTIFLLLLRWDSHLDNGASSQFPILLSEWEPFAWTKCCHLLIRKENSVHSPVLLKKAIKGGGKSKVGYSGNVESREFSIYWHGDHYCRLDEGSCIITSWKQSDSLALYFSPFSFFLSFPFLVSHSFLDIIFPVVHRNTCSVANTEISTEPP